jgi:hypothetical protein
MAKKQQPKQLSPENYIKTKARTLPIYKCYVTEDWKKMGMANVIVIRQHTNGNFTFGGYLVDLFALGTKDTMCNFNQPKAVIDDLVNRTNFVEIDYNLAHNIVYGGNEYAEDHGFKIHKNFDRLTKYILEIDDEKIPIIDVEFGKDGKPLVIANMEDLF